MNPNQNTINNSQATLNESNITQQKILTVDQIYEMAKKETRKRTVNPRDLALEKPYQIYGWKSINFKDRLCVIFDLGEFEVWGNKKCSSYSDIFYNSLVAQKMKLVYKGLQKSGNFSEHIIEFTQ